MVFDVLTEIYSSFELFYPPAKEAYVDCQEVRGGWEVVRELGRKITRSKTTLIMLMLILTFIAVHPAPVYAGCWQA